MNKSKAKIIDTQLEVKFSVSFIQKLKFIRVFIIYFIGKNKFNRTYLSISNKKTKYEKETFLKELVKNKTVPLIIGTALSNVPEKQERIIIKNEFNSITPENALKWGILLKDNSLGTYDFSSADQIVDFSITNNINIHGHSLIWGKIPGMGYPKDLQEKLHGEKKPNIKLFDMIENHLYTVLNHYKGRIQVWDVVNEPFELSGSKIDNNIFYRYLGIDYIEQTFKAVHSIDSSLRLVLNEQLEDYNDTRTNSYLQLIENLLAKNTPVHSIGIQSHILFKLPSIKKVSLFLKRLSNLGLSFEVTEFDLRIGLFKFAKDPYQAQADYAKRFFEAFMEYSEFLGFTFWSCFDNENWMDKDMPFCLTKPNSPCLFDAELNKKPLYHTISELLRK